MNSRRVIITSSAATSDGGKNGPANPGRTTCSELLHVLLYPLVEKFGDLQAVLLDHYHVPVAPDALIFEPD